MDASRSSAQYELKSELARLCLPSARRDANRNLAWVNSICILFVLIGIVGAKPAAMVIRKPPPLEQVIPTIIEPPPPPTVEHQEVKPDESEQEKPNAPQVVVATQEAPNINFSVPTIANLVVPKAVAVAPPLNPMHSVVPLKELPSDIGITGTGGDRPKPVYPTIAKEQGIQGTVALQMTADESGNVIDITITKSSGSPVLDRAAVDFIKRHWILPTGHGRLFETSITYRLTQ
ncbi:MAG TPA: TonB family protein [Verrucomicrobiae bacterium]|nr:TonB family protein [Verrucomicrobiae bacterium]